MHAPWEEILNIGKIQKILYQKGYLIALWTLRATILSISHLVLEGEYVQACHLVSSMLSFPLHCCYTISIGNSPLE